MNDIGTISTVQLEASNKERQRERESRAHQLLGRAYGLGLLDQLPSLKQQVKDYFDSTQPLGEFEHTAQYDTRGELVQS